jgi:hypothetical protein
MNDDYIRGLSTLRNLLPETALLEFEVLEARMLENLHHERLYGSTRDTASERFAIVDSLNHLAWKHKIKSFTELCFHPQTIKVDTEETPWASTKFSNHNAGQSTNSVVPPRVKTEFFTHVIPTAYYHLLSALDFPFFQVVIDNAHPNADDAKLSISAFIEDYSDLAKVTVEIAKGERKDVTLLPVLKHTALATLNDMRKVTLQISVRQDFPDTRNIYDDTKSIHLMARNRVLIATRNEEQRVIDLTRYLAAWVTPNNPEVAHMLRYAYDYHPGKALNGYQDGETTEESAKSVREQARAIFSALKYKAEFAYVNSALNWEIQPGWITQKVRLPGECLTERGLANCLDGTVLFASLLELIGIKPLLVLVPGHAFVGWHTERDSDQYEFLETTMIGTGDFDQAQAQATTLYTQAMNAKDFERELFHPFGFARLIDVVHYRHKEGIYPLE